jgi:hypothetical protein
LEKDFLAMSYRQEYDFENFTGSFIYLKMEEDFGGVVLLNIK